MSLVWHELGDHSSHIALMPPVHDLDIANSLVWATDLGQYGGRPSQLRRHSFAPGLAGCDASLSNGNFSPEIG